MLTVYSLQANVYADDLIREIQKNAAGLAIQSLLWTAGSRWWLASHHLDAEGKFKSRRLKLETVSIKTNNGLLLAKAVVKKCKGTLIAMDEETCEPVYIEKGVERKVAILDFNNSSGIR